MTKAKFALILSLVGSIYFQAINTPLFFDSLHLLPVFSEPPVSLSEFLTTILRTDIGRALTYQSFRMVSAMGLGIPSQNAVNMLLHGLNGCLLLLVLRQLFSERAAFLTAIFFVVNPAAIYAVCYLVERSQLLMVFFGLIQCLCYIKALESRGTVSVLGFVCSLLSFRMALLSKQHAIVLLAMYPILGAAFRSHRSAWFCGVISLVGLWAATSVPNIGPNHDYVEYYNEILTGCAFMKDTQTLYWRSILTQSGLFFRYFASWIVPLPTSIDMRMAFTSSTVGLGCFVCYVFSSSALLSLRKTRFLGVGLLLAACLFAPELSVPRTGEMFVMYRSYLFALGFMMALGWFFERVHPVLMGGLIAVMLLTTLSRLDQFKTPANLWTHAASMIDLSDAEVACQGARAFNNAGSALIQEGRFERSAIYLRKAIDINHVWFAPKANLAAAYYYSGQFDKARPLLEGTLKDPTAAEIWPRAEKMLESMRRQ